MKLNIYACFSNYSGCRETLLCKLDMTGNFLCKQKKITVNQLAKQKLPCVKKKKRCNVCECMYWHYGGLVSSLQISNCKLILPYCEKCFICALPFTLIPIS